MGDAPAVAFADPAFQINSPVVFHARKVARMGAVGEGGWEGDDTA